MHVVEAKVDWHKKYTNDPRLIFHATERPDHKDYHYQQKGSCYYADLDGMVSFYHYSRPGDGFGGRTFELTMVDGDIQKLKGPWSSRAGAMNAQGMFKLFDSKPCVDVVIHDRPFDSGYMCGLACSVTVDVAVEACKLAGVHLVCIADKRNSVLDDVSAEQFGAVVTEKGGRYQMPWDKWTELPSGVEFWFAPSMEPDRIVKEE